jgi:hypothetical protein
MPPPGVVLEGSGRTTPDGTWRESLSIQLLLNFLVYFFQSLIVSFEFKQLSLSRFARDYGSLSTELEVDADLIGDFEA